MSKTNQHAESGCTDYLQHNWDSCPFNKPVLFVMNRQQNTAAVFEASCFEELQAMFRVGIGLPDGLEANAIGRCKSKTDFLAKAARGGTRVQSY